MSLADLRANPPKARPERTLPLCLAPDIVAEVESLTAALDEFDAEAQAQKTEGPPLRVGQGASPEAVDLRLKMADALERMRANEGEMTLRATRDDGAWRNWVNAHPARSEDEPGHDRDQRVTSGICNADALIDDLATYAWKWDGERLADDDWASIFEPVVGSADKAEMAAYVVSMYETRLDFSRLRSGWSASLKRLSDSAPQPS